MTTSNTFLTNKDRKRYDAQFKVMLQTCHDNLERLCNERYPETIEGVLAENPVARNPAKLVALNKRINAQSERIEDLLLSIQYPDQCECPDNSFLTAGDTATNATTADIQADIAEAFSE